jgi:predicted RNA binding protein YcfA (HicA-like mRNA interferase family)/predicted RNase H-like HicB family nuclease
MSTLTAIVHKEDNLYAQCPEIGTASQGETIEEAVNNLQEATELYLEEFPLKQTYRSVPFSPLLMWPPMPELPRISGDEAIKVFTRLGFHQARQKGSHDVMRRQDQGCVIPRDKELAIGTLRSAIRQAGLTVEKFVEAYNK